MRDFGTIKLHEKGKIIEAPVASGSRIDPVGKVFHYKGGIYRAITQKYTDHVIKFLTQMGLEEIFEKGLVKTEITGIKAEDYGLVIRHHDVKFKSLPYEWCGAMVQDTCRMIVQLGAELYMRGYSFKDGQIFSFYRSKRNRTSTKKAPIF